MNGVVVVDKPAGMTSHDLVQRLRRAAGTRRVGHAGTLDPMATGVLVVMLGEATKLGPYLTADDKSYRARVVFGAATDTLDAEGSVVATAPLPAWWPAEAPARIERALAQERARQTQEPPLFSAIKVAGRAAHARARRGEEVALAPRPVAVRELRLVAVEAGAAVLELRVGKGYYVRSLARDLGHALGCPAHLAALRRTASGAFDLALARPLDALASAEAVRQASIALARAAELALPAALLTDAGAIRARAGQPLGAADFAVPPPADRPSAWLVEGPDRDRRLVAVGRADGDKYSILRGFN